MNFSHHLAPKAALLGFLLLAPTFTFSARAQTETPQASAPQTLEPLGIALESLVYPRPVKFLEVENGGQKVRMAYQYALAPQSNGRTVLLLHGKNFGGYYWKDTINALNDAGYNVVVPDQIGFGKSSKPDINYTFDLFADNTAKLLDSLGVAKVAVVGHSMGGMVATRFSRRYPNRVEKLILENPIGLEDYGKATGKVPLDRLFADELKDTDPAKIRAFYQRYFVNWKPEYEYLPAIKARVGLSGEFPRWAKSSAQTYKTILEQPVVGDFPKLRVPTLLVIGQSDRTVVGKNYMTPEKSAKFGDYPSLGQNTAKAIPGAKLVELPKVGHIPHLEASAAFHEALLAFLAAK